MAAYQHTEQVVKAYQWYVAGHDNGNGKGFVLRHTVGAGPGSQFIVFHETRYAGQRALYIFRCEPRVFKLGLFGQL